ncbi:MAG: hypothetical protein MI976_05680 [Pseudomonadales bacterium]|nr:hypothetical protein [Pseudomonadales bacterium]
MAEGDTTTFTLTPDPGFFVDNVIGCDGALSADSYTTNTIIEDCTVTVFFNR